MEKIFADARVVIFVIDPMEEKVGYAIDRLHNTIIEAFKVGALTTHHHDNASP